MHQYINDFPFLLFVSSMVGFSVAFYDHSDHSR